MSPSHENLCQLFDQQFWKNLWLLLNWNTTIGTIWSQQLHDPRNQQLLDAVTGKAFQHQVTKLCECKYVLGDTLVWLLLMSLSKLPTSAENLNQLFDQQFWNKKFGYFWIEKQQLEYICCFMTQGTKASTAAVGYCHWQSILASSHWTMRI